MKEVRRFRLEKGWNQNELAFHADLAPSVISLVETGRREPNATTLRKLADALGVDIPDLFERGDSPKASASSPEVFGAKEWERRRSKITGLTLEATELRKIWAKELQGGGLAEHRAIEISFAISGVLESAQSPTILGGLERTNKADAKQVKRLREELERLVGLLRLSVKQVTTGIEFKSIIDGVVFEQGSASPVETTKRIHA